MYTCVCACVIGVAVPVLTSLNYELICLSMKYVRVYACMYVHDTVCIMWRDRLVHAAVW